MRIKVSNYIARKLVESGIVRGFSVVGGGAMHLNNALGHEDGLTITYNHQRAGLCDCGGVLRAHQ